jgi:hypothetical protein
MLSSIENDELPVDEALGFSPTFSFLWNRLFFHESRVAAAEYTKT